MGENKSTAEVNKNW